MRETQIRKAKSTPPSAESAQTDTIDNTASTSANTQPSLTLLPPQSSATPMLCIPTSPTTTSNTTTVPPASVKKTWKRGPRKKCCFSKCVHNERTDPNIMMIVNLPKHEPLYETARFSSVLRHVRKN